MIASLGEIVLILKIILFASDGFVASSNIFDTENNKIRGLSDLGIMSDSETAANAAAGVITPPNTCDTLKLANLSNNFELPFVDAPYYATYMAQKEMGTHSNANTNTNSNSNTNANANANANTNRRSNSEVLDPETSFKYLNLPFQNTGGSLNPTDSIWVDLMMKSAARTSSSKDKLEHIRIPENVSHAAVVFNSNSFIGPDAKASFDSLNSIGDNLNLIGNEKESSNLVENQIKTKPLVSTSASASASASTSTSTFFISEFEAVDISVPEPNKPISYKDALKKSFNPSPLQASSLAYNNTKIELRQNLRVTTFQSRKKNDDVNSTNSSGSGSSKSIQKRNHKKPFEDKTQALSRVQVQLQAQTQARPQYKYSTFAISNEQIQQSTFSNSIKVQNAQVPLPLLQQDSKLNLNTANFGTASPTNRYSASQGDIAQLIVKSIEAPLSQKCDRSGSDISGNSQNLMNHKILTPAITKPVSAMINNTENDLIPLDAVPYNEWCSKFRMPRAFAPPSYNVFQFPRHERGDKNFLNQLKEFRKSLRTYKGKLIKNCPFEDYEPKLNYYGREDPKHPNRRMTNSPLMKIFNAPPVRNWIPVRCDALGVEFKVDRAVDGHAGKVGGKALVSIVYDAKNTNSEKKTLYIRKEYYDLEYFTNEYNFLQFAHHAHLPKPICVEYGQYPKIVMDYVEGERVHQAFYNFGLALQSEFKDKPNLQWLKLAQVVGRVLAKLLITLKYINSIGFIHADFKPENVIYNLSSGRVVVIDFDLSVSAPYAFTGRGTEATVAPEVHGLLKGPVHFGIDWWAYGSTAAMMIAAGTAGILHGIARQETEQALISYTPFKYVSSTNQYKMTPIPVYFPPVMRSFLYPFFNPDPRKRVFSEANAYNWIRSHAFFNCVSNWDNYENVNLGEYASRTPLQLGFIKFSYNPILLRPTTRISKIINDLTSMFGLGTVFTTTNNSPPETSELSPLHQQSDDDEEDDDDEESIEEEESVEEEEDEESVEKESEILFEKVI